MATAEENMTSASPSVHRQTSARGSIALLPYFAVLAQLGLLLLIFRQFQIETEAFRIIAIIAFGGFAVHALLPMQVRLGFFAGLSALGIVVTLGLASSAWLFLLGGALIAICHLPCSVRIRVALLFVALLILAGARAGWIEVPWSAALWPVLGAMFMFRLIVYFYDLRNEKDPTSLTRSFSYFFMLPNVCFPLFPVIDWKTFRRNYYDDDAFRIYQKGVHWMLRGVVHLILYRVVYYYGTLAPSEVIDPSTLFQFLLANFLLYLRISGLFHLIIGLLYLFGFRLPETHQRYLLAASFTDFWRRINIYWKDFMLKVFYYPTVFKLKRHGPVRAMMLATVFVFIMTWFLHAYQWFWLRGTFLMVWQDVLFWAILGGLVVVNALLELKYGRKRALKRSAWRTSALTVGKTFVTFWAICVLWSFWTSESVTQWLGLWSALSGTWSWTAFVFPLGVLAVILLGSVETPVLIRTHEKRSTGVRDVFKVSGATAFTMALVFVCAIEPVHLQFGPMVANVVHSLRSGRLSRLDVAKLEHGYYENLLSVDRFNSQLWEVYMKRPPQLLSVETANVKRFTNDFAREELMPSRVSQTNYGTITVNRWGMRDQDYELAPAPGTHRSVILGPSNVMGWGVDDAETFESLMETRLDERARANGIARVEILNFGVPGYQPPQQLVALEKSLRFSPDAVIYVAPGRELSQAARYLAEAVREGIAIPYQPLADIVSRAGLTPAMDETEGQRRLAPHEQAILSWIYARIVEVSRAAEAEPILVFVPQVRAGLWSEETAGTLEIAENAGFLVIDLSDVYAGRDIESLRVAEWDDHPNALGHRLIADRLAAEFEEQSQRIFGRRFN